jgi:hypothetical protein
MTKETSKNKDLAAPENVAGYDETLHEFVALLEASRRATARAANAIMTATYWEIGRRIVEIEQGGKHRAGYGEELLKRLAKDLTARFGRGFSRPNLNQMRAFYLSHERICQTLSSKLDDLSSGLNIGQTVSGQSQEISQTLSAKLDKSSIRRDIVQTASAQSDLVEIAKQFPLSWSHYVKLLAVKTDVARKFYEDEALARYALDGLPNKVLAREYLTLLPDEKTLQAEIEKVKRRLGK